MTTYDAFGWNTFSRDRWMDPLTLIYPGTAPYCETSWPDSGTTQPSIHGYGVLFRRSDDKRVVLNKHLPLTHRLRMSGEIPLRPPVRVHFTLLYSTIPIKIWLNSVSLLLALMRAEANENTAFLLNNYVMSFTFSVVLENITHLRQPVLTTPRQPESCWEQGFGDISTLSFGSMLCAVTLWLLPFMDGKECCRLPKQTAAVRHFGKSSRSPFL
jgi:hypothetical protein